MNIKLLKFILFFLITISSINKTHQIYFVLDPYETRCISKMIKEKSTFSGSYYASGEYELMNSATIKNSNNEIIWRDENHSSASFNLSVEKEGIYTLCLQCLSDRQLNISFDFHDEKNKKEPLSVRKHENKYI
jgi:hypothetical protein